jgi:Flp pilus assembly pilin Flp
MLSPGGRPRVWPLLGWTATPGVRIQFQETGRNVTAPDRHALSTLWRIRSTLSGRSRNERGAAMIEYALLVGLIAVVAVVGVAFMGTSVSNLFTHANSCLSTTGDTSTQSGTSQLSIANSQMSNQLGGGNQLSTGQRINSGSASPDASACAATANNGNQNLQQNQQQVLQLLH